MIIWVASYPKSGNTWVRSVITSLFKKNQNEIDFKDLYFVRQYPLRSDFSKFSINIDDINELSKNWINSQNIINSDKKLKFLKTHYSLCNVKGNYFTDIKNTFGAIYIVRDPRNIITSINHHFSHKNINESLEFLFDDNKVLGHSNLKEKKDNHIITPIASWGTHYNSWKVLRKNFLLIKYENLLLNPYNEFNKIIKYIEKIYNITFDGSLRNYAIQNNSFEKLKELEKKKDLKNLHWALMELKKLFLI
tara:strand:- start:113 stop:859 length:747 start_codon:yes stop_codon:yes gene_type:complete